MERQTPKSGCVPANQALANDVISMDRSVRGEPGARFQVLVKGGICETAVGRVVKASYIMSSGKTHINRAS